MSTKKTINNKTNYSDEKTSIYYAISNGCQAVCYSFSVNLLHNTFSCRTICTFSIECVYNDFDYYMSRMNTRFFLHRLVGEFSQFISKYVGISFFFGGIVLSCFLLQLSSVIKKIKIFR